MHSIKTRITAMTVCVAVIAMILMVPLTAYAQESGKTVRVGWYESPFNTLDQFGRRSGYAYDYQKKIAAYTGWNYEYVEGSWPELLQMLINGEIDLMSDVSYTDERAESMLFSSLPMGAEEYYIFISPDNEEINRDNLSTFNGKKAGANKGSVQAGFFREWAEANGVQAELIEMTEDVDESLAMLNRGDIDMYVVLDGYLDASLAMPVCKVGASDFFFAVNKSRPDLLTELNAAMNRIQEENHNYQQQLYEKYLKAFGYNYYLSTEEKNWLSDHGPIRIGYQDNYLSFCAMDRKTGKLTGLLNKDYFYRYVCRLDHVYKDTVLDAIVCDINRFHSANKQYGRQFCDQVLRSIGSGMKKLARETGGIVCREAGDTFLLYCPHQDNYEQIFRKFLSDAFEDAKAAGKVSMRFGVFTNALQEANIEERFNRAKIAADRVKDDPQTMFAFY